MNECKCNCGCNDPSTNESYTNYIKTRKEKNEEHRALIKEKKEEIRTADFLMYGGDILSTKEIEEARTLFKELEDLCTAYRKF